MSDDTIDVKIRAQTADLKPGMEDAAKSVQSAAQKMRESMGAAFENMKATMTGASADIKNGGASVGSVFKDMAERAKEAGGGVGGALTSMRDAALMLPGPLSMAAIAVAGLLAAWKVGEVLKDAVNESSKFTNEANKLARTLGITTTEASGLSVALGDIYSDSATFTGAASMLGRQLRQNEDALKAVGLQTRDASGGYRNLNDLMMDSIKVINGYKEGTDRNLAAMTLWGRGASEAAALLKLNNQVLEDARQKQESLGLIVGKENVEANKKYRAAMNDVGDVMSAIQKVIGDAFMPVLTKLGEWFAEIAPPVVFAFKVALSSVSTVVIALMGALEALGNVIAGLVAPITSFGKATRMMLEGDMKGATKEMTGMWSGWGDKMEEGFKRAKDSSTTAWSQIKGQWGKPTDTDKKTGEGKEFNNPTGPSRVSEWELKLADMKVAYQKENDLREFSKEQELAYWESIKSKGKMSKEEMLSVSRKVAEAELAIMKDDYALRIAKMQGEADQWKNNQAERLAALKKVAEEVAKHYGYESRQFEEAQKKIYEAQRAQLEQERSIAVERINNKTNAENAIIDQEEKIAQIEVQLGLRRNIDLLAQEQEFENRRNEIKRNALEERKAQLESMGDDKNPVEYAKVNNQLEELERQHQLKMLDIRGKIAIADPSVKVFSTMESSFGEAITGMLTKAETLRQSLANIYKSIFASFVQEMVSKPLAMAAVRMVRESALFQALFGAQVATQAAASSAVVATKTVETGAVIAGNAAQAASGAAASQASIPFVGPALAMAAAAAMMSFVMGMGGKGGGGGNTTTTTTRIPSAAGGYDIPSGVNPMTQLHENEMVLPAHLADPLRDSLAGGGGGVGGGTVVINTSGGDFIHKRDLAKLLKTMKRDFKLV
jgi:hypothetical protein